MDGGIDAVYTYQLGDALQQQLQAATDQDFDAPSVGRRSLRQSTRASHRLPCAPTMRVSQNVADTANAYLAFRPT